MHAPRVKLSMPFRMQKRHERSSKSKRNIPNLRHDCRPWEQDWEHNYLEAESCRGKALGQDKFEFFFFFFLNHVTSFHCILFVLFIFIFIFSLFLSFFLIVTLPPWQVLAIRRGNCSFLALTTFVHLATSSFPSAIYRLPHVWSFRYTVTLHVSCCYFFFFFFFNFILFLLWWDLKIFPFIPIDLSFFLSILSCFKGLLLEI